MVVPIATVAIATEDGMFLLEFSVYDEDNAHWGWLVITRDDKEVFSTTFHDHNAYDLFEALMANGRDVVMPVEGGWICTWADGMNLLLVPNVAGGFSLEMDDDEWTALISALRKFQEALDVGYLTEE